MADHLQSLISSLPPEDQAEVAGIMAAHSDRRPGWCACYAAEADDVVWAVCPSGICAEEVSGA